MAKSQRNTPPEPDSFTTPPDIDLILATDDPWLLWKEVSRMPKGGERHVHYPKFIALVAKKSANEREALLKDGKEVWGYLLGDARKDVAKLTPATTLGMAFISAGMMADIHGIYAEAFWRADAPSDGRRGFLVYDVKDGTVAEVENLEVNGATYYPPPEKHLQNGVFRLPSGVEDYGTTDELYREIIAFITRYNAIEDESFKRLAATYVFLTWAYEKFDAIPYLRIMGDFGGGKSRFVKTIGWIAFRSMFTGGTSAPSLFRAIDQYRGTVVVNEADTKHGEESEAITQILLNGYERGFPVWRTGKDTDGGFDVQFFDVYGPKILSTRGALEGALESRCLSYTAVRTVLVTQPVQLPPEFYEEAERLRNKLVLWRFRNWAALPYDPHARIPGITEPRIEQLGLPLIACLPPENGATPLKDDLLTMLRNYSGDVQAERGIHTEGVVLAGLYTLWSRQQQPRILVKTLVSALREDQLPNATSRKVTQILRKTFRFQTSITKGNTTVIMEDSDIVRLQRYARHYRCAVDDFAAPSTNGAPPRARMSMQ